MIKIQNYRIEMTNIQTWEVPTVDGMTFRQQVLGIDVIHGAPFAYILVDDEKDKAIRNIIGLNGNRDDAGSVSPNNYMGSAQFLGGLNILHLFWDGNEPQ